MDHVIILIKMTFVIWSRNSEVFEPEVLKFLEFHEVRNRPPKVQKIEGKMKGNDDSLMTHQFMTHFSGKNFRPELEVRMNSWVYLRKPGMTSSLFMSHL